MANKQIKDFDLKESINGLEDLLIQDSDGTTKRIKTSKLMDKPSIPSIDGLATKEELTEGLATKANVSHTHDQYLTEHQDLSDYALKTEIPTVPTKTSQLTNDSGFIKSIPSEYVTETELNAKGYLTEHQDISMKANKTELHSHSNKTVLDGITSTKVNEWDNKSDFDGNYNSLTNKPKIPTVDVNKSYVDTQLATKANKSEIPSLDGYATETYVTNKIAEASLSGGEVDLSGLATKAELATKADKVHTHDQYLTEHQDLSDYALKTEIPSVPTKTSQLTNDKGYLTSVPSEYVTETELNAKGYLTEHQNISGKVDKVEGKGLSTNDLTTELKSRYDTAYTHSQSAHFSGSYTDLKNKPNIPSAYVLPQATDSTLGGVKVGTGLNISEGTLSLGSHTHTIANVTNLQAELNKKANTADLKTVATSGSYNDLTNKPTIPTSLPANGGNADTVNNIHIVVLTQEDYDGLEVKDETTLYIIKG